MQAFYLSVLPLIQWILKTSLQGSLLVCLIFMVKSVLRGRLQIRWHYYLWLVLLVRLAMPWVPHSRVSVFNLVPERAWPGRTDVASRIDGTEPEYVVNSGQKTHGPAGLTKPEAADTTGESRSPIPHGNDSTQSVYEKLIGTLPLAWLMGALGLAGYISVRNFGLWRAIRHERPVTDQEIQDLLEDCKMQMRVRTIVGVIVTDRVRSPALFGFIRPRLLLPQGLIEALNAEELQHVFLHELAHLKRRDIYLGWLASLLQIIHWFNPLIWLGLRRMRTDQELSCDALVLSTMDTDEPTKYGRTIINLFEKFSQVSYLPSMAGILEDASQLERRIEMIANPGRKSRARSVGAVFLLAALSCVALTDAHPAHTTVDSLDLKVPASLHSNVLLYLSFDRDGGTRAVDISGMDFHGELHG
ncbi:MAG: M56 family metallopeptidase, partial [Phycisphaerales bacterium]